MKKLVKKLALSCTISLLTLGVSHAQTKLSINPSADIVSSYIWRGTFCAATSVQPGMEMKLGNFSLSGWGSSDFTNDYREADFSLGYSTDRFSLSLNDYWWTGMSATYFNAHLFEASIGYTISEDFPLSLSWSTMLSGPDFKSDGSRAYSTFIETSYAFDLLGVEVTPSVSISPWESMYHLSGKTGTALTTVAVNAAKDIKISNKLTLPVFSQIILAPNQEECYFLVGISLF